MKYSTIRIEGFILSADILDKIEQGDIGGQSPKDFGFDTSVKVKDEIAKAWADAHALWQIFKHQREKVPDGSFGTTETRRYWIIPLLGFLGYDIELSKAEIVNDKSYALSHRASNLDKFPIHIMGFNDSLDKKRVDSGPRMSPHALVQEYLNLTEHLYAIVTNGIHVRLLRDSSRLIKLSFIEFDLETMMEDEHYADFAIMFRLLHSSRMPVKYDAGDDCIIEKFHQDSLDSGSRIREGLSEAVERSIISFADGFLKHPANDQLRKRIVPCKAEGMGPEGINAEQFYQFQLRLIYRLLFLIVIEERNLIYPDTVPGGIREIYYKYYSVNRIRYLSEKRYLMNRKYDDLWTSLKNTFILFENEYKGKTLEIKPLAGELFDYSAIGILNECSLDNQVLLECFRNLSLFTNKNTGQKMRVNYASLNVEEFGSVYEGLLEYRPEIKKSNGAYEFNLVRGSERSSSGSHYTPDELVQPLIKHSLDYIIEDKLKETDKEKALLSIKVCDVACGSGHILLNAARRIGTELARIRTGEDQPSPAAIRQGVRDAIQNCIYGVDKNPLAVELCKVALWLEAHNPGKPLSFLDHHIKCGDAIVGLANKEELDLGIPNAAFKRLPDDDKDVAAMLSRQNKEERRDSKREQARFSFDSSVNDQLHDISDKFDRFQRLSEDTKKEREEKQEAYKKLLASRNLWNLKVMANIPVAQFFIPKTKENGNKIITESEYRNFLNRSKPLQGVKVAKAMAVAQDKRFFHWFLEFPDVFKDGGFDCILGNPPFLGGQKLSGTYGNAFLECIKYEFAPIGAVDLVTYFFRRIFGIIKPGGFQSLISTNTIAQGKAREDGLDIIVKQGGAINHAVKSMKWPGKAAVEVALVTLTKQAWNGKFVLAGKEVKTITPYLDDAETLGNPFPLKQNKGKSFQGSIVLGKGFVLKPHEARALIAKDPKNKDVLFPYLNGDDLNNNPDQSPSRWVINFFDWTEEKAKQYPDCYEIVERLVKPERIKMKGDRGAKYWWQFLRMRGGLYRTIAQMERVLVVAQVSKTLGFVFVPKEQVISMMCIVLAFDSNSQFSVLQTTIHKEWVLKYASALKSDIRYTPSDVFETFSFPQNISPEQEQQLDAMGESYHEHRRQLMMVMQLGLTKTYNLFHRNTITATMVDNKDKTIQQLVKHLEKNTDAISLEKVVAGIIKLRELHVEMDNAVLQAYGWQDVTLNHDFYEVDYLPENDRIRYTISPEARKEILKRLLELNHKIHEQEEKDGLLVKTKKGSKTKRKNDFPNQNIFQLDSIDK